MERGTFHLLSYSVGMLRVTLSFPWRVRFRHVSATVVFLIAHFSIPRTIGRRRDCRGHAGKSRQRVGGLRGDGTFSEGLKGRVESRGSPVLYSTFGALPGGSGRENCWTESMAVGSRNYVEMVKVHLEIKAIGRNIRQQDGACSLCVSVQQLIMLI